MASRRHSIQGPEGGGESKKGAIILIAVVALIAALAYFMFFSGPSGPGESKSKALLSQSALAVENAGKVSFTFEASMDVVSETGGLISMPLSGEGRMDPKSKRMYFKINFEAPTGLSNADSRTATLETYAIGNDSYIGFAGNWTKISGTGKSWGGAITGKLLEFAKGFNSVIKGTEKINGRDAIKVEIKPTLSELASLVQSLDPGFLQNYGLETLPNGIDSGVKNIDLLLWIDSADYLPVKTEMSLEAETKALSQAGTGVSKLQVKLLLAANFDFKTPFNIVLPSEAQDAVEIAMQ